MAALKPKVTCVPPCASCSNAVFLTDNRLLFSNKTAADVFLEEELRGYLGNNLVLVLTREEKAGYAHGHIDADFLKQHVTSFAQPFCLCGPEPFVKGVEATLIGPGAGKDMVDLQF